MNGNSPAAQDYGQALDAAVDRAIRHAPKGDREFFEWVLEVLTDGGADTGEVLSELASGLLTHEAFDEGIAKREGFQ